MHLVSFNLTKRSFFSLFLFLFPILSPSFLRDRVLDTLSRSRGDEEALVDGSVYGSSGLARVGRDSDVSSVIGRDKAPGTLDGGVGDGQVVSVSVGGRLTVHELPPSLVALVNNLHRILFALGLARECENVLRLAVGDFVDPEPLVGGTDQPGEVALDVLHIVQSRSERVVHIDNEDFPVGLAFVEERHDTEDLDLLHLADVPDSFTNLAHVERVVVPVGASFGVLDVGVLPCLRERTIVPDITVVGETVSDVSELALFNVLLDRVERLFLGDLHLGVGPSGNLDNHVEDSLGLVGKERNVVEGRNDLALLLDVDTVLC